MPGWTTCCFGGGFVSLNPRFERVWGPALLLLVGIWGGLRGDRSFFLCVRMQFGGNSF